MGFELSVQHAFPDFKLSAQIEGGDGVTALFGPSGSGKTTLVRAMAGIFRPQSGRAALNGRVLFDDTQIVPPHTRRIGYVFQDGRLFPHKTVAQNIDYGAKFARGALAIDRAGVIEMLGIGGLLARRPHDLSGGEAQRVALARALLSSPEMLLMDEPLAALDGPRKDEILPYLERLKRAHRLPILYVSHSIDEIARLADQVVVLRDGAVAAHGTTADVLADPKVMPLIGVREASAVLEAVVKNTTSAGLARLDTDAGLLELPGVQAEEGDTVRLRILASDVILARTRPEGLSARNILPVTIGEIQRGRGPGAAVVLHAGRAKLLARITVASLQDLGLEPGQSCFAILKANAVARSAIGT